LASAKLQEEVVNVARNRNCTRCADVSRTN
jgi:hypothetical protein